MIDDTMGGALARSPFASLGVAVSGGGDSVALLHLLRDWCAGQDVPLHAVTVDHGLRPEAADEARFVAELCAGLGVSHDTLTWSDWDRRGNLQDAARTARYGLIADWAQARGVNAVALGHTLDDQAETVLMRLARGSGVDGLAAMQGDWTVDGTRYLRPLLHVSREDLRQILRDRGLGWMDDPSNEDARFDRVKARRALAALSDLGLDANRLSDTAIRMKYARNALERHAQDAAYQVCTIRGGDVVFDLEKASDLPYDTQTRLYAHALMWVASAAYRPRRDALFEAIALAAGGDRRTLHGCMIQGDLDSIVISREYNAVRDKRVMPGMVWDSRWRLDGPEQNVQIRALGNTVSDCPEWRETGLARRSLMASPAVWRDGELLAAPLAGLANGWTAQLVHGENHFFTTILSH